MEEDKQIETISTGLQLMPKTVDEKLHYADIVRKTPFVPKAIKTREEAFIVLAWGHELRMGPMESFQNIYVVNNKPSLYANALLGMVRNHPQFAGIKIESNNKKATVTLKRKYPHLEEVEEITISFGEEDAKRAGLMKEDSGYQKYPERMFRARAIKWACQDLFPDVGKNLPSKEEAEENFEYEEAEIIKTITIDLGAKTDEGEPILEAIQITKAYEEIAEYFDNKKLTKEQKILIAQGIKNDRAPFLIKIKIEEWLEKAEQPKEEKKEEKSQDKKLDKNSTTEQQNKKLQDLLKTHVLTEKEKKQLQELATDKEGASTAIEIALDDMKKRKEIEKFVRSLAEEIPELTAENLKVLQENPNKQSHLRDYILNEKLYSNPKEFNKQIKGVLNL